MSLRDAIEFLRIHYTLSQNLVDAEAGYKLSEEEASGVHSEKPARFVTGGIGPGGADGNTPRDYLRAPGYRDIDLALLRDIHLERGIIFQIRGEAINAFNLVSLNAPTANLNSSSDGFISGAASPRVMQVGVRLTF